MIAGHGGTPAEGLRLLDDGSHYDLAILDLNMPEIDGLGLARLIRADERNRALPLVLFTSVVPLSQANGRRCGPWASPRCWPSPSSRPRFRLRSPRSWWRTARDARSRTHAPKIDTDSRKNSRCAFFWWTTTRQTGNSARRFWSGLGMQLIWRMTAPRRSRP